MKTVTLLLLALAFAFALPSTYAQRGNSRPVDIHQSLDELEAEYLRCLDAQSAIYDQIAARNSELAGLYISHNKAQGKNKERLSKEIDKCNSGNREDSIAIARIGIELQRIKLGIDRLTRYDQYLSQRGRHGQKVQVKTIDNLTFKRSGPVRMNGRLGFQDFNVWEITFTDGSTQRLEEKTFTPIR